MSTALIVGRQAEEFAAELEPKSVHLICMDPPYYGIVEESWDMQWTSEAHYVLWMMQLLRALKPAMADDASLVFFGGIGKHGFRPFFKLMFAIEDANLFTYRNLITWKKRRAYGKSHDYLFCREEIAWYSMSPERTKIRFNIPLTTELRGYPGWNKAHPAKSPYKRVSNVWTDIPELMKTNLIRTQKPVPLLERLIQTHSHPGDLVVDCFSGSGTTGLAALRTGRRFRGCEANVELAAAADSRCRQGKVDDHEDDSVAGPSVGEVGAERDEVEGRDPSP